MGRRALRGIDPTLDVASYFYELETLAAPLVFGDLFEREAPLELEVGSGKGLFLQAATQAHPERNYLGVELARRYARFAAARLAKRDLTNGKMIRGDAVRFCREWLAASCLGAVHVYFPDPWWKKRHKKRRVMNAGFLRDVERVLVAGGSLHFWTDVEEYYRSTLDLIAEATSLRGPLPVTERPAAHELDYRTHFERRMRLHDLPVFRSEFHKVT